MCNELNRLTLTGREPSCVGKTGQAGFILLLRIGALQYTSNRNVGNAKIKICLKTTVHCQDNCIDHLSRYCRSARPRREIIPLDKWEILPEQIEYEEELGRGAFGVVYKAILKKRQGVEVFDTRDEFASGKDTQVVAVKELQGAFLFCNHYILVESHIGGLRCLKCYSINCMLLVRL